MPSVIDQLWHVYKTEEWWQTNHLTYECFCHYTKKLIEQGNIFYVLDGERVVGYTEVWKINFEQFGRFICEDNIVADAEDVLTGPLALVANVWIDKEYRDGFGLKKAVSVVKTMRKMYYQFTRDVKYHCGHAERKQAQLIKVFRADKLKGVRYERV